MRTLSVTVALGLVIAVSFSAPALAADEYVLTLKDHTFIPKDLTVPANKKITLVVKNEDSTAAEFESHDLNREKVISPNSSAKIIIGPLDAGTYSFFDEFNEATTKGTLIVE